MEIDNLYQDDALLALDKPSGLSVHRSQLCNDRDTLIDRLKSFHIRPSPVHRLDRATSGVIICTFNSIDANTMRESFEAGLVSKKYIAIVRGHILESGRIDIPLKKDGVGDFQVALTKYKPLDLFEIPIQNNRYKTSRYSLIEVEPQTGRFHQIRRHLARIGHPLLGDTSHGDLRHNRIFEEHLDNARLLLHALSIAFPHPKTKELVTIVAPIPVEMVKIVHRLKVG